MLVFVEVFILWRCEIGAGRVWNDDGTSGNSPGRLSLAYPKRMSGPTPFTYLDVQERNELHPTRTSKSQITWVSRTIVFYKKTVEIERYCLKEGIKSFIKYLLHAFCYGVFMPRQAVLDKSLTGQPQD